MKRYYAKKRFEYTNVAGKQAVARAGETVSIILLSEEKALKKQGCLKELSEVDFEPQAMTSDTIKGERNTPPVKTRGKAKDPKEEQKKTSPKKHTRKRSKK